MEVGFGVRAGCGVLGLVACGCAAVVTLSSR
jgi:hypothetical protein